MGRAVYVSGVGLHHDVLCISGACFFVVGGVLYASGVGSHLDVPCISGACLLLWAGFSVFQGLGHIMMYCIFPDHVSCCATSWCTAYFRGVPLVLHHYVLYLSAACLLGHVMMYSTFQRHVCCCATSWCTVYFRGMSLVAGSPLSSSSSSSSSIP